MKKRYRYITCGRMDIKDPISKYRLISNRIVGKLDRYAGWHCYRVWLPEDLILEKWSCDEYATTNDTRTLEECGYDIMIMIDEKFKVVPKDSDIKEIYNREFDKWRKALWHNQEQYSTF